MFSRPQINYLHFFYRTTFTKCFAVSNAETSCDTKTHSAPSLTGRPNHCILGRCLQCVYSCVNDMFV